MLHITATLTAPCTTTTTPAGARLFFRSLEAAIFLFARVARIPEGSLVLPAICTEERIVLGAELEDGTVIKGQNDISHPPGEGASPHVVDKSAGGQPQLDSPIRRVFYLSKEGCARVRSECTRGDCLGVVHGAAAALHRLRYACWCAQHPWHPVTAAATHSAVMAAASGCH